MYIYFFIINRRLEDLKRLEKTLEDTLNTNTKKMDRKLTG